MFRKFVRNFSRQKTTESKGLFVSLSAVHVWRNDTARMVSVLTAVGSLSAYSASVQNLSRKCMYGSKRKHTMFIVTYTWQFTYNVV